jgi:hypothetical protein
MLLQATLGISIDGIRQEVQIDRPLLPIGVESVSIRNLAVQDSHVDLEFRRIGSDVVALSNRPARQPLKVLTIL